MKKTNLIAAAAVLVLSLAGCGQKPAAPEPSLQTESEASSSAETEEAKESETLKETETARETVKEESPSSSSKEQEETALSEASDQKNVYEDNFSVDSAAAAAFAEQIKSAVAQRDLNALADLTAFPVYVGLPDVNTVSSREDFLSLGAEAVFTDELVESVAGAQTENLQPSMAGFSLSGGQTANINFGVRDGVLAISGINY